MSVPRLPKTTKITDIGEFGLIRRIARLVDLTNNSRPLKSGTPPLFLDTSSRGVIKGIGDDAAILDVLSNKNMGRGDFVLAVSKDMLVEGVHFKRQWMSFFDIGRRAIVANVSDMAAMGGAQPLYIVVGLALPVDISVDNVDKLFMGMDKEARNVGAVFIGGDTVKSNKDIVISITIMGYIEREKILLRSGAREGDLICVTGTFGDATAGIELLKKNISRDFKGWQGQLVHKYRCPSHRLNEAKLLAAKGGVDSYMPTSMTDSSDGLAASLRIITQQEEEEDPASSFRVGKSALHDDYEDNASAATNCLRPRRSRRRCRVIGARIDMEKIPLSKAFLKWSESKISGASHRAPQGKIKFSRDMKYNLINHPDFPWKVVLDGGEEYELVFTASKKTADYLARDKKVDFKVIGEITSSGIIEYFLNGRPVIGAQFRFSGYENF